jgi:hypothetical protein
MRRDALPVIGLVCSLALLGACYRAVLFEGGQFAYRDASHFYYPLYQRVQQEWSAGRWPLWDPGQNGGMPLLGNPMAAVLYPGKVLYALLPYAWGARLYIIAHTVIALLGAVALGRSFGVSRTGSLLGGLSYAFGGPVLSQYCNVIFLVGAAWVPWGLRAIDRLLRQGRRIGGAELAAVLALQVLGGDPESAYLTAACGAGYAALLSCHARGRPPWLPSWPQGLGAVAAWAVATLVLAPARPATGWSATVRVLALGAWAGAVVAIVRRWRDRPGEAHLAPMLGRLAASCALAAALAGAQLLPVLEFAAGSARVGWESTIDIYLFSLEPYRLVELAWPNVFGTIGPENRSWVQAIPPAGGRERWVESLFMGGLALVLALGAAGWRGVPSWRAWMTAVAAVALVASFGKFAGPLWWARWGPFASAIGSHDPGPRMPRFDGFPHDGMGSPYGLLAAALPGFDVFRFPSKLLTFAAVALATLAGAGWDLLAAGVASRPRRLARIGLAASLLGLAIAFTARGRVVALLAGCIPPDPIFGPSDVAGAWSETRRALAHGAIAFAACLALARAAPRRPRLMGALAPLLLTADLAAANARLVWTIPQADFEATPEVVRLIEAAEGADPSPGPFRIHRLPDWYPGRFRERRSARRLREMTAWDRATLRPLHALPLGLDYSASLGYLELEDAMVFFRGMTMPATAEEARASGIAAGEPISRVPRHNFNLWGTRYFLLPARPEVWGSVDRDTDPFLAGTDPVAAGREVLRGAGDREGHDPWDPGPDWQLRRNRSAFPRAWIVHYARVRPPVSGRDDRDDLMQSMQSMYSLRAVAWIETDEPDRLKGSIVRMPVGPSETVTVVEHGPQRVELKAVLDRPGLVILADTYYPGWRLTIDGEPATIYRANRLMRGAAVPAGEHTLVYTYRPQSFRVGAVASIAGLVALTALVASSRRGADRAPPTLRGGNG